jgi:hypothetical protein
MDMPQKEAFEKLILRGDRKQASVSFLVQGMAGRTNELWNFVDLFALTFCSEPQPTRKAITTFRHRPLIACMGVVAFRSGTTIPK